MTTLERLSAALADRYRIERELGQGGMAVVYQAHDVRHDRDVRAQFARMEPELYRYPAIDPRSFREAVDAAFPP